MRERTVKIGSAGKIFSLTGWKVGFVLRRARAPARPRQGAPVPHLHDAAQPPGRRRLRARQRTTPISRACARDLARSRDRFAAGLRRARLHGDPVGGHLFPQHRHRRPWASPTTPPSAAASCSTHGVAAIPVSAFYADGAVTNRGALLLRETRRDPRCGAGAVGGGGEEGGLEGKRPRNAACGRERLGFAGRMASSCEWKIARPHHEIATALIVTPALLFRPTWFGAIGGAGGRIANASKRARD